MCVNILIIVELLALIQVVFSDVEEHVVPHETLVASPASLRVAVELLDDSTRVYLGLSLARGREFNLDRGCLPGTATLR